MTISKYVTLISGPIKRKSSAGRMVCCCTVWHESEQACVLASVSRCFHSENVGRNCATSTIRAASARVTKVAARDFYDESYLAILGGMSCHKSVLVFASSAVIACIAVCACGCKSSSSQADAVSVVSDDDASFVQPNSSIAVANPTGTGLPAAVASSEPMVPGTPIPLKDVQSAINSRGIPPYAGPTGVVEGTVSIAGDAPPEKPLSLPPSCAGAAATYGKLFREGDNRVLADAVVAVTGYDAFVPAKSDVVHVAIRDCAYSARTYTVTFGQRIDVENLDDDNSFIPVLLGSKFTAFNVAVPKRSSGRDIKTDPVRLYPQSPGHYALGDYMKRDWMLADVIVLKYSTHAVSGVDGRFRIEGVPVGEVEVNAWLPSIDSAGTKKANVVDGATTVVDFVLTFDEAKYRSKLQSNPAGAASGGKTKPSASSDSSTPVIK